MVDQIKPNDIDVLASYQQAVEINRETRVKFPSGTKKSSTLYKPTPILLGVLKQKGELKLVKVEQKDITCSNLFLRIFGYGKLAHIDFSLKTVAGYLEKFNWTVIKDKKDEDRSLFLAFKGVCSIANRWARHNSRDGFLDGNTILLDYLSEEVAIKGFPFKINSQTEVCDLGNQVRRTINLLKHASLSTPDIEKRQIYVNASNLLKSLDRDNRFSDRAFVPITTLRLNDESILPCHHLLPQNLDMIKAVRIILRLEIPIVPMQTSDTSQLLEIVYEKYEY
jgi:hypothetical protein